MAGVDGQDQMPAYYPTSIKTNRWYNKLGIHMIEMMLVNAHMLYSKLNGINRTVSLYDYKEPVIQQMLTENYESQICRRRINN